METWKVTKNEGKELKIILQNRSRVDLYYYYTTYCYHMHFCKGRDFLFHKNNGNIIGVVAQVIVRKNPTNIFFSALFFEMLSAKCSKRYCVSVISCHIAKKMQHNRVETTAMFFFKKFSVLFSTCRKHLCSKLSLFYTLVETQIAMCFACFG